MSTAILVYALLVVLIALTVWVMRLERRLNRFLYGKDAKSLEDAIWNIRSGVESLGNSHEAIAERLETIDRRVRTSIRGIETTRFNPFKDSGGNQSFATAFLNEEGDGVVVSSLYARDRVSIFAKPIKGHRSSIELSEEEERALMGAQNSVNKIG